MASPNEDKLETRKIQKWFDPYYLAPRFFVYGLPGVAILSTIYYYLNEPLPTDLTLVTILEYFGSYFDYSIIFLLGILIGFIGIFYITKIAGYFDPEYDSEEFPPCLCWMAIVGVPLVWIIALLQISIRLLNLLGF